MKELKEEELDNISGGITTTDNSEEIIKEKWKKVGIKIVQVNGYTEYYLIKDGTKISPKKALEIYTVNGGTL